MVRLFVCLSILPLLPLGKLFRLYSSFTSNFAHNAVLQVKSNY